MIKSFRRAGLEKFFRTGSKAGIQPAHARKLENQLLALNNAADAADMNVPGWSLHPLKGELAGHRAIKVNGNWPWPSASTRATLFWWIIEITTEGKG